MLKEIPIVIGMTTVRAHWALRSSLAAVLGELLAVANFIVIEI